MKKNDSYKIEKVWRPILSHHKGCGSVLGFVLVLLASPKANAQDLYFTNTGTVKVNPGTIMSVHENYLNKDKGNFVNDGEVHIYKDWENNGTVTYNEKKEGATFFTGKQQQLIEGDGISDFQNIIFNNQDSDMPFDLKTAISVGANSDFKKGVINALYEKGKMIFKQKASHSNVSDNSFVDGKVQKIGDAPFIFPVGNDLLYRPTLHGDGSSASNEYTTQYFLKNSNADYPHESKEKDILFINNKEYWEVTKDKGEEKIVLSLSLNTLTTPSQFFDSNEDTQVAIVRWDENKKEWVNDWGELGSEIYGQPYSNLLMGQVGGYGIFTMAIVKKKVIDTDIVVFNAITPNDDGINDAFHIKGIDKYPDNEVEIYNRWGVKVYEAKSYNETDNMFKGYSDGRATIKRGDKLPTGTYFYILKYNKNGKGEQKSGYLYINNQ